MLNRASRYTIKDIEHLSNIKAHTIRIWEQRYKLLIPERTTTNIRYYNDDQLRMLLNVNTLLNNGMKISQISKLSSEDISNLVEKLLLGAALTEGKIEALIGKAIVAVLAYDERLFEKIFNQSVLERGLVAAYSDILHPILVRTGQMWATNNMLPAQEHFLSNILERKLHSAIDELPIPKPEAETWILFLMESEEHELGLLIAQYILRKNGKKVIYLGRRLPVDNLYEVIRKCNPVSIYTFFIRNRPEHELNDFLSELTIAFKRLNIFYSGRNEIVEKIKTSNKIRLIENVKALESLLNITVN